MSRCESTTPVVCVPQISSKKSCIVQLQPIVDRRWKESNNIVQYITPFIDRCSAAKWFHQCDSSCACYKTQQKIFVSIVKRVEEYALMQKQKQQQHQQHQQRRSQSQSKKMEITPDQVAAYISTPQTETATAATKTLSIYHHLFTCAYNFLQSKLAPLALNTSIAFDLQMRQYLAIPEKRALFPRGMNFNNIIRGTGFDARFHPFATLFAILTCEAEYTDNTLTLCNDILRILEQCYAASPPAQQYWDRGQWYRVLYTTIGITETARCMQCFQSGDVHQTARYFSFGKPLCVFHLKRCVS